MDQMRAGTALGSVLLVLSAVLLIFYGIFDQLDGMQARRRGGGSALGDFLDHWVDALMANLIPVTMLKLGGVSAEKTVLLAVLIGYGWWANNWEVRNRGERLLPLLGGLELIWVGVFITLLTAAYGSEVWNQELFGIALRDGVYWTVLGALLWALNRNLQRCKQQRWEFLGLLLSLGPLAVWYLALARAADPGPAAEWLMNAALLLIGLAATKHAGDLMRQHWMGIRYRSVDASLALPALGLALIGLGGWWQQTHEAAWGLSLLLLVVGASKLVWQLNDTYRALGK